MPYGQIKCRKQQPKFYKDEAKLKAWISENCPDYLIEQEPKIDWANLKKRLKAANGQAIDNETGEVLPGVEVEEPGEKFTVEVDTDGR